MENWEEEFDKQNFTTQEIGDEGECVWETDWGAVKSFIRQTCKDAVIEAFETIVVEKVCTATKAICACHIIDLIEEKKHDYLKSL